MGSHRVLAQSRRVGLREPSSQNTHCGSCWRHDCSFQDNWCSRIEFPEKAHSIPSGRPIIVSIHGVRTDFELVKGHNMPCGCSRRHVLWWPQLTFMAIPSAGAEESEMFRKKTELKSARNAAKLAARLYSWNLNFVWPNIQKSRCWGVNVFNKCWLWNIHMVGDQGPELQSDGRTGKSLFFSWGDQGDQALGPSVSGQKIHVNLFTETICIYIM